MALQSIPKPEPELPRTEKIKLSRMILDESKIGDKIFNYFPESFLLEINDKIGLFKRGDVIRKGLASSIIVEILYSYGLILNNILEKQNSEELISQMKIESSKYLNNPADNYLTQIINKFIEDVIPPQFTYEYKNKLFEIILFVYKNLLENLKRKKKFVGIESYIVFALFKSVLKTIAPRIPVKYETDINLYLNSIKDEPIQQVAPINEPKVPIMPPKLTENEVQRRQQALLNEFASPEESKSKSKSKRNKTQKKSINTSINKEQILEVPAAPSISEESVPVTPQPNIQRLLDAFKEFKETAPGASLSDVIDILKAANSSLFSNENWRSASQKIIPIQPVNLTKNSVLSAKSRSVLPQSLLGFFEEFTPATLASVLREQLPILQSNLSNPNIMLNITQTDDSVYINVTKASGGGVGGSIPENIAHISFHIVPKSEYNNSEWTHIHIKDDTIPSDAGYTIKLKRVPSYTFTEGDTIGSPSLIVQNIMSGLSKMIVSVPVEKGVKIKTISRTQKFGGRRRRV